MQPHVKAYLKHFGYTTADTILCESCGKVSVDIHHLTPRSRASKSEVNKIENLIALCRECHNKAHDHPEFNEELKMIHRRNLLKDKTLAPMERYV